jgi:hypothetical protein
VSEEVKVRKMSLDVRFWFLGEHSVRGSPVSGSKQGGAWRFAR